MSESSGAKVKLTLREQEEYVNTFARKIANEMGCRFDFRIHLMTSFRDGATSMMEPGGVVRIYLLWPDVLPQLKTILKGWFRFIQQTPGIWTPLTLASHIYSQEEREKWGRVQRRRLTGDPADEFPELIPQFRVKVTEVTITTYEDTVTGESIHHTTTRVKPLRTREVDTMWRALSALVRDKYPDEDELDEEANSYPTLHKDAS